MIGISLSLWWPAILGGARIRVTISGLTNGYPRVGDELGVTITGTQSTPSAYSWLVNGVEDGTLSTYTADDDQATLQVVVTIDGQDYSSPVYTEWAVPVLATPDNVIVPVDDQLLIDLNDYVSTGVVSAWSTSDTLPGASTLSPNGLLTITGSSPVASDTYTFTGTNVVGSDTLSFDISIADVFAQFASGTTNNPTYGESVLPGDHASITVEMSDASTILSQAWGLSSDDDTFGTGSSPTTFSASDNGDPDSPNLLVASVTTAAGTFYVSLPIRGTASPTFSAQPSADVAMLEPGGDVTITPGTSATPGTVSPLYATLAGSDVTGVSDVYTVGVEGTFRYREEFVGSGGSVTSNEIQVVVNAYPDISASGWTGSAEDIDATEGGTLYYLIDQNATRSSAQIKAGTTTSTSLAGSAAIGTGTTNIPIDDSGLSGGTYYRHYVLTDGQGADSNVVDSASFSAGHSYPTIVNPTAVATGAGTPSLAWTTGHQSGDYGILFVISRGNTDTINTPSSPNAFTNIQHVTGGSSGKNSQSRSSYYVATGSSMAAETIAHTGLIVQATMFLGRGLGSAPTAIATATGTTSAASVTSIPTPSGDCTLILAVGMYNSSDGAVSTPSAGPSGWTLMQFYAGSVAAPLYAGIALYKKDVAGGQSVSDISLTLADNYGWTAQVLELPS